MKKTALTYRTLDRFETLVNIDTLTQKQIEDVEHYAYCANMGGKSEKDTWEWFSHLVKEYLNIDLETVEKETENSVDVENMVYNLVKAARFAEPVRTEELKNIKAEYGADLYKRALNRVLNEEDAITVKLWEAACSGEIETLKAYYENGGKIGRTWLKFGSYHSLVAGAWRNGNYEVVRYLLSMGEKPLDKEREEINLRALYLDDIITAAENVVDYFRYHNKNITKAQEWKIEELAEALQLIK